MSTVYGVFLESHHTTAEVMCKVIEALEDWGEKEVRGETGNPGAVVELRGPIVIGVDGPSPFSSELTPPPSSFRYLSLFDPCPARKPNTAQKIYELLWILSGRRDLTTLSLLNRRVHNWSDNGGEWRGGYGARVMGDLDYLRKLINHLYSNPTSRQAVLPIFHPVDLIAATDKNTRDVPCTLFLHFMYYPLKKAFRTTYVIRSNDIIWGFSHINWNLMKFLGLTVLRYTQNGLSMQDTWTIQFSYIALNLHNYLDNTTREKYRKYRSECCKDNPEAKFRRVETYPWWEFYSISFDKTVESIRLFLSLLDQIVLRRMTVDEVLTTLKEHANVLVIGWPVLYRIGRMVGQVDEDFVDFYHNLKNRFIFLPRLEETDLYYEMWRRKNG